LKDFSHDSARSAATTMISSSSRMGERESVEIHRSPK
jgi:hypothetical protein